MRRILCVGLLAMLAMGSAYAEEVKVTEAWTRATVPGQDSASVQLTITSGKAGELVAVSSSAAQAAQIHSMYMQGDQMYMRELESLALPAQTPVMLGSDGNHLMLMGLKQPLKAGDKLPLELKVKFANGSTVSVKAQAVVRPLNPPNGAAQEHQH